MIDEQVGVHYDEPIQPGPGFGDNGLGSRVTRQLGIPPGQQVGIDPTPPPPVIQGSPEIFTTRNAGPHVTQRHGADGTLQADRRADDNILFVDHALSDPEALPPGLARTAMPLPPPSGFGEMTAVQQRAAIKAQAEAIGFIVSDAPHTQPPVAGVIASDAGSNDPRDASTGPQILDAAKLPTITRAPIVPVSLSVQQVARVKKGGRK